MRETRGRQNDGGRFAPVRWAAAGLLGLSVAAGTAGAGRLHEAFDAGWRFSPGDAVGAEDPGYDDSSWRTLDLPHDWSIEFPFSPEHASGTGYLPGGIGWYRKTFVVPADLGTDEMSVLFDGVYRNSDVWINGHHLGHRPNGYISFAYRLTPHLRAGETNTLAVRVARENVADSRWYPGTGIYRHVWLTRTGPVHIGQWGVFVTTPRVGEARADVTLTVDLVNPSPTPRAIRLHSTLHGPDGGTLSTVETAIEMAGGAEATAALWHEVPSPQRWSPDHPVLYRQVSRVFAGDDLLDEQTTPFGIRTFRFDPAEGFFLNEEPLILRGVCMHHDAGAVGAAVPEPVLARRLRQVKSIGGNAVRASHNPMAPEFYDLCDRLGLLVMDEAFDEWEGGKRKWVQGRNVGTASRAGYHEAFAEWGERDCADMVRRDRNHPSIILWSIGNEIDYPGDPFVHPESFDPGAPPADPGSPRMTRLAVLAPRLIAAVKRHDPTRPVTMALSNLPAANAVGLPPMLDVSGYNYQEQYYLQDHRDFPGRVILGSENGAGPGPWGPVRDHAHISGQFLWVGFDFLGEAGPWPNHASGAGLFDTRGFAKPSAWRQQALWDERPTVRMLVMATGRAGWGGRPRFSRYPRRWAGADGEAARVVAYTNCDRVELRLNDQPVAEGSPDDNRQFVAEVPYAAGRLEAVGIRDGEAVCRDVLESADTAARLGCEVIDWADGIAHLEVRAEDGQGRLVTDAGLTVTAAVEGAGRLLGIDNGNTNDPTPLLSPTRTMTDGRLLALLRVEGPTRFTVSAPGVEPAALRLPPEQ